MRRISPNSRSTRRWVRPLAGVLLLLLVALVAGCGNKGPLVHPDMIPPDQAIQR